MEIGQGSMASAIMDFEINRLSLLHRNEAAEESLSDEHAHNLVMTSLRRVLLALGRLREEHRVSERGDLKYMIKRYRMTSFVYLAPNC